MAINQYDELADGSSNAEAPQPLPKKKGFAMPGWSAMDKDTRRNIIIFLLVVLAVLWFLIPKQKDAALTPSEETTGDPFAGASISNSGGQVDPTSNEELIASRRAADAANAQEADEEGLSGVQNVEYSSWVDFDSPSQSASPSSFGTQEQENEEPINFARRLTPEQVQRALQGRMSNARPFSPTEYTARESSRPQVASEPTRPAAPVVVATQNVLPKRRGILPTDSIPCRLEKTVNSDVSRSVVCEIIKAPLIGGKFMLSVERQNDYVYLSATTLTFQDNYVPLNGALAVESGDIAANGIRDSVDYHTAMRWSSLLVAGAGSAVTALVGNPRTVTTNDGTQTRTETLKASRDEIIVASLAKPAELGAEYLLEKFNTPPTVQIEKDRILYIMFSQPVEADWLPDFASRDIGKIKIRQW